jgi:pimeloyl-ACP methyl ester carboxylesterase
LSWALVASAGLALATPLLPLAASAASRVSQPEWRDPSNHEVRLVAVEEGVHLEVLDWGGEGPAIVLLAGAGSSAHVYDELAPELTDVCHVYGITRRGHGASSRPPSGYDEQRLADDVLRVLDSLHIEKPVVVGHSMAGGEITKGAHQHSDRLAGLVYLDALGDPRDWPASDPAYMALVEKLPASAEGPPAECKEDRSSFGSYRDSLECRMGFAFPESELRNTYRRNADGSVGPHTTPGSVHEAIGAGQEKRDYSNITVPVLALFEFPRVGVPHTGSGDPQPLNDEERAALRAFEEATKVYVDRWVANLTGSVPEAKLVDLPGAGHYVFLTRRAEVLNQLRSFVRHLTGVPALAEPAHRTRTDRSPLP